MKNLKSKTLLMLLIVSIGYQLTASDPDAVLITANKINTVPQIDGDMDAVWEALPWYSLNYVWMDWETIVDSSDYYGHFKIAWSEETDLLYFFIEITDDVLIERYAELQETVYYNDIVEVFLDEDGSGGMHVFDGSTNAENAFSYHITPLGFPEEESPVTDFRVQDIDGTGWGDNSSPDYISHFPEAILVKKGNQYYWEFSLTVFDDSYEQATSDGVGVELTLDKELGIALAYCEADDPENYRREMFLGSMEGNSDKLGDSDGGFLYGYNDTWQNADDYSVLKLGARIIPDALEISTIENIHDLRVHGDVQTKEVHILFNSKLTGDVSIDLFDMTGKMVYSQRCSKISEKFEEQILFLQHEGLFIARISQGGAVLTCKFIMH
jgi:hypothetical protein